MKNILLYVFVLFGLGLSAQTVTCPADTDLGTYDCFNINDLPDLPGNIDEAMAEPYNIEISGATESTRITSEDSGTVFYCVGDDREITREVIVYEDLDFDFTYDVGEEIASCFYTITTVPDTECPIFDFIPPNDEVFECGVDIGDLSITGIATMTDNCPILNLSESVFYADAVSGTPCERIIQRSWEAVDACGSTTGLCERNILSVEQRFTVVDTQPPTFTPPPDVSLDCGTDPSTADTGNILDALDLCTGTTVESILNPTPEVTGCTSVYTKIWNVSDDCGNSAIHNQLITINCGCDGQITVYMSPEGIAYDAPEGGNVVDVTNGTLTEGECGGCDQP